MSDCDTSDSDMGDCLRVAVFGFRQAPAPVSTGSQRPSRDTRWGQLDERGSATVVMLAVIAAVLTLTVSGLMLSSAVLASHRARSAADLAALAAAGALLAGEPPYTACQSAARVAAVNDAQVQGCVAFGDEVQVSVAVQAGVQGLGVATARSRAGPGLRRAEPVP
jgi:secretion/DNA translocation related TadE-like protein